MLEMLYAKCYIQMLYARNIETISLAYNII